MDQQVLIDRDFLEKLERLAIHWQKSFPGLVGGHNPSRYSGPGQEFLDHRHFHHGDDLRGVNWRAYLRFEKLFMKMFHIEPRIPVRLLLDSSQSMATADGAKFHYARRLAAALCYIGLVRLDTIVVHPFSQGLGDAFSCWGGRHRFAPMVDFLTALRPQGATSYHQVVRQFSSKYLQRGLLIVISDFLDDEGSEKPLQYLADYGHELFLIQVWDEEDRTPPWDGELRLTDAETGSVQDIDFDSSSRARYTELFDEYARGLQRVAMGSGGRYAGLSTSISIDEAIFGPVARVRGVQ
ncbi:MAG: DUF58 domain-containing protein [Bryobacteraceae bacterium]|nr:DUF58 domain-containing protein [Bryobacteraceae bacterium]